VCYKWILANFTLDMKISKISPLIITALALAIFSGYIFFRIIQLNKLIFDVCEPRQFADWVKIEKTDLTQERIKELEVDYKNCIEDNQQNMFKDLFGNSCDSYKKIIEQGFETKRIPDEDRRAQSIKEVNDYEMCLNKQALATKEKPDYYKFLFYGNSIILAIGILIFVGLNQKNK